MQQSSIELHDFIAYTMCVMVLQQDLRRTDDGQQDGRDGEDDILALPAVDLEEGERKEEPIDDVRGVHQRRAAEHHSERPAVPEPVNRHVVAQRVRRSTLGRVGELIKYRLGGEK